MSWYEFQIHLPQQAAERTTSAQAARHWIASLMANAAPKDRPDLRLLHGTTPETSAGIATIRFGWGNKIIRILAVGEASCDLLAAEAHKVTRLLSRSLNMPLRETRHSGTCRILPIRPMQRYAIRNLALRDYQWDDIKQSVLDGSWTERPEIPHAVASTIETGLRQQCELLAMDAASATLALPDDFMLQIDSIGDLQSFRVKPDADFYRLSAVRVRFSVNVELQGVWHVGRLISRGLGLVQPSWQEMHPAAWNA